MPLLPPNQQRQSTEGTICTKSFFCWGFAPDPTGGAHSTPPDSVAVFRRPASEGRGEEEERRGGERRRREGNLSFALGRKKNRKVGSYGL